jgi:hypothetical protein
MLSELCLSHFIGHRTDFARSILAGIAGLGVSDDGWERKSTISQEVVVVMALCWPVEDVHSSVVYRSIVLGFGRLFHRRRPALRTSVALACISARRMTREQSGRLPNPIPGLRTNAVRMAERGVQLVPPDRIGPTLDNPSRSNPRSIPRAALRTGRPCVRWGWEVPYPGSGPDFRTSGLPRRYPG